MKKCLVYILTSALLLIFCSCGIIPKANSISTATDAINSEAGSDAQSLGLEFRSNGDGTCTLTGFGDFSGKELTIPAQSPAGDTVTAIDEEALALSEKNSIEACTSLETLIFDHVDLTLSNFAVCDLDHLTKIIVKDSTITLDDHAFGCRSIKTVQVENSTLTIGEFALASDSLEDLTGNGSTLIFEENAFSVCNIQQLVLTDCNTTIEKSAFDSCELLTTLTVQGGVLRLGEHAFAYCDQLESIHIDNTDVDFGTDVFYGCSENLILYLDGKEFNSNCEEIVPIDESVTTVDDLSITLPSGFQEFEAESARYAILSDTAGIVFFKKDFSVLTDADINPDDFTLEQFAQAVISSNNLEGIETEETGDFKHFNAEVGSFKYYICVFRGTDAFWQVNFYTYTEKFDEMLPQFEQWAASITFG